MRKQTYFARVMFAEFPDHHLFPLPTLGCTLIMTIEEQN